MNGSERERRSSHWLISGMLAGMALAALGSGENRRVM